MAKAIKTPKQPKEPVRVRYKTLSDGSQSVYLDIYRDGKRQYEFLKLYLIPETNAAAKAQNKATLAAVNTIKSQRIIELTNGVQGESGEKRSARKWQTDIQHDECAACLQCKGDHAGHKPRLLPCLYKLPA